MGNVQHSLTNNSVFELRGFSVELWSVKDCREEKEEPAEGEVPSEHEQQGDDDQVNHYFIKIFEERLNIYLTWYKIFFVGTFP